MYRDEFISKAIGIMMILVAIQMMIYAFKQLKNK
jgi:hypothetical protein